MADQLDWIDADGTTFPLHGTPAQALWGLRGRFSAPIQYLEQALPLEHGSQVLDVHISVGEVSVPFDVVGSTEAVMRQWLDDAAWAFNPLRGMGRLRSTRSDGTGIVRDYPCYLKSGFDSLEEAVENGFAANAPRGVLVFRGGPFWEDVNAVTETYDTMTGTGLFFPVQFPWYLANSSVFAQTSIENPGHIEAWPEIYIEGPGSGFQITNQTTGEYLAIDYTIPDGDGIQIETATPGNKRIYLASSGADLMGVTTGAMFPFAPGTNQITVALGGATSASLVSIEFHPRYFGP